MNLLLRSPSRGFTLIELVLALSLAGLLTWLIVPGYAGLKSAADDDTAIARACMLQAAKTAYLRDSGQAAYGAWLAAVDNADKYHLLKPYIGIARGYATLDEFSPEGYSFAINALDVKVAITRTTTGTAITY